MKEGFSIKIAVFLVGLFLLVTFLSRIFFKNMTGIIFYKPIVILGFLLGGVLILTGVVWLFRQRNWFVSLNIRKLKGLLIKTLDFKKVSLFQLVIIIFISLGIVLVGTKLYLDERQHMISNCEKRGLYFVGHITQCKKLFNPLKSTPAPSPKIIDLKKYAPRPSNIQTFEEWKNNQ